MLQKSTYISTLIAIAIALIATPAFANWGKGSGKVKMKELIPKLSSSEAYSERYGFAVDFDGSGHVGIDFTISNLGWGDQHGAVQVRVTNPETKKKYKFSKKVDEGDWSSSKGKLDLNIASTRLTQKGSNAFRLQHNGKVKVDLTFTNRMPMWHPGDGIVKTDAGYYQFNLIAPRADVTGTVKMGGKTFTVDEKLGGYADHVATDAAPFDFAKRFSRMRNYNGDVFVIWREITLSDDLGAKSITWIMIGYKDKIVFSDSKARFREGRIKQDAKSGYRFPMSVQIDGKKGGDSIKLVMKGKRHKRKDLLEGYGAAVKAVAGAFSEPIQFDVSCEYTLQMDIGGTKAQIKGDSHYVVDQLNK